ncbi:MAG: hypothetical protein IMY67_11320 [Bacteroidetes bacterium]|nr:hypothetical protein [Bacteroidota bacterium]
MAKININTDAAVKFTNTLEKLGRSDLPVAVRTSLNSTAFDVKKKSMPLAARFAFEERKKNFFKATSRVDMAKGFKLSSMKATMGFLGGESNQAVANLAKQERGGSIGGRSFIPMTTSRVGKSSSKPVRKQNRLSDIRNIVDARNSKGRNKRQKFVKAAIHAGVGGIVLAEYKGKKIVWRVNAIKGRGLNRFKLTALYSYEKGRSVNISKATNFMQIASNQSARKMESFFIIEAKKRIQKAK